MVEAIIKRVLDTVRSNRNVDLISVSGDYGARFICAVLAVDGVPIKVAASCAVTINAKRADGQSKAFEGSVNEDGTVKVPITQWMLEIAHTRTECTVSAVGIDTKLSATPFDIEVAETPHQSEEISPDDPDYDVLVRVLAGEASRNAAEAERVKAEEARALAEKERASAETERDQAETEREEAEALRATAETQREQAEASRNVAEAERVKAEDERASAFLAMDGRISRNEKRVATLEAAVYGDLAQEVEDNSVAYVKDVPSNALSAVKISKIGGMTYKDGDTLKSAPVTEVESVGVNLCKPLPATFKDYGYTVTKNDDGSVTISGAATTAGDVILNIADPDNITLDAGKEYALKMYKDGVATYVSVRINYTDEAGGTSWGWSNQDTSRPRKVAKVYLQKTCEVGDTSLNGTYKVMLNKDKTALPYTPYIRHTLPVPEAVQALDGYGEGVNESVYNYIDYEKKQFVKRVGKVDMGTLTWAISNGILYNSTMFSNIAKTNSGEIANILCAEYQTITTIEMDTKTIDKSISYYVYTSGKGGTLKVYDSDYTAPETFKAAMSGVMLYYELATPEVTDISDILSVDNYIEVEGNGSLTFENEYKYDVPSGVTFVTKEVSE